MNIVHGVTEGSGRLVGGGVEDLTKPGDSSKGRLHREETTAVSRVVDRATSVSSESTERLVGLDSDGTACGGATGEVVLVNGVLDASSLVAVESEGAHTHLVHVGGAHDDGASITQLLDGG